MVAAAGGDELIGEPEAARSGAGRPGSAAASAPAAEASGAEPRRIAIVGAGPAGLMAAELLASAGHVVDIYDQMPSPARKLLMAGRGGLNLTHSAPLDRFLRAYDPADPLLRRAVENFPPERLIAWANGLGCETFVGSSGRVFPRAMKASPLLRAWLARLSGLGVTFHFRRRLTAIAPGPELTFAVAQPGGTPRGEASRNVDGDKDERQSAVHANEVLAPDAVVLAMGGASWPRLGSDGNWVGILERMGVRVAPLAAGNVAVAINWSEIMRARHAGTPLKRIVVEAGGKRFPGEVVITATGLEGGPVYAAGRQIRTELAAGGEARIRIDLRPDLSLPALTERLGTRKAKQSTATHLAKAGGLSRCAIALLREAVLPDQLPEDAATLARLIKAVELRILGQAGLERAISTVGGVTFASLDQRFMLERIEGVFVAGEMLDWEAPTGGFLLQATFATAVAAATAADQWLNSKSPAASPTADADPHQPSRPGDAVLTRL
ncbi:MAG: TIGR03862 family flavoprotein [Hyphomicrobiaceae bacterium]|nr:TIGR03862 family flavoprotein [Hyphomicrobiaceae bacterium]